jgi:hypothetical protein
MTLPNALTNAGEKAQAELFSSNIIDKFHREYGFTNARATNNADFATLYKRRKKVDHFDASVQDFGLAGLKFGTTRWRGLDIPISQVFVAQGWQPIEWLAKGIEDSANGAIANRDFDTLASALDDHTILQTAIGTNVETDNVTEWFKMLD